MQFLRKKFLVTSITGVENCDFNKGVVANKRYTVSQLSLIHTFLNDNWFRNLESLCLALFYLFAELFNQTTHVAPSWVSHYTSIISRDCNHCSYDTSEGTNFSVCQWRLPFGARRPCFLRTLLFDQV